VKSINYTKHQRMKNVTHKRNDVHLEGITFRFFAKKGKMESGNVYKHVQGK